MLNAHDIFPKMDLWSCHPLDNDIARHDIWSPWYSTYMINLYRWTSLVVWLPEGIVLQVRIFGHIFFRKSRNLYLRPPVGRETIKPYPGGCMALWVYRDVSPESGTNQGSIFQMKSKLWIWPPLPLLELETEVREDFTIMEKAPALLGPSPGLKCLLALSQ